MDLAFRHSPHHRPVDEEDDKFCAPFYVKYGVDHHHAWTIMMELVRGCSIWHDVLIVMTCIYARSPTGRRRDILNNFGLRSLVYRLTLRQRC